MKRPVVNLHYLSLSKSMHLSAKFCSKKNQNAQNPFLWIIKEQLITWHYILVYYKISKKEHTKKTKTWNKIYLWDPFLEIVLLVEPLYLRAVLPVQNEEYWAETENKAMP